MDLEEVDCERVVRIQVYRCKAQWPVFVTMMLKGFHKILIDLSTSEGTR
jgi:hypothetical protein